MKQHIKQVTKLLTAATAMLIALPPAIGAIERLIELLRRAPW
jgi:hypothetical protein